MIESYIAFFLLVFGLGVVCGMKFALWRGDVARRREEHFWATKKQRVLRRI